MKNKLNPAYITGLCVLFALPVGARNSNIRSKIDQKDFNPSTLLWYDMPAKEWEEALPVGNDRLGAMVFWQIWRRAYSSK